MKTIFNKPVKTTLLACTLLMAMTTSVFAHSGYLGHRQLLSAKRSFAERELKALAEPFVGLRTSQGQETGLFPIKTTGVSTEPIVRAAESFLSSLSPDQHVRTVFAVDDPEWRRWCNVDKCRIHSPVLLIEFDHQRPVGTTKINPRGIPTRDHIHVVVRTPNGNDYGKDLLRQHLERHPH